MEKNLNEKTAQIKRLMEENSRLTGKVTELEEKEKKFYYQEMVFDQELQKKSREGNLFICQINFSLLSLQKISLQYGKMSSNTS